MSNYVNEFMVKYSLTAKEASGVINFIQSLKSKPSGWLTSDKIDKLLPFARDIKRNYDSKIEGKIDPQTGKPYPKMPWGMAFYEVGSHRNIDKFIGKKRNLPSDRRDTQFIQKTHPGPHIIRNGEIIAGGTKVLEDEYGNKIIPDKKYTPTQKRLQSVQGGEIGRKSTLQKPKYYWAEDGAFIHSDVPPGLRESDIDISTMGEFPYKNREPPEGYKEFPFIMTKILHITGSQRRSPSGIINTGRQSGERELGVFFFIGKDLIESKLYVMPYESNDVEFNRMQFEKTLNQLKTDFGIFLNKHRTEKIRKPKPPRLSHYEIKNQNSLNRLEDYYGDEFTDVMWKGFLYRRKKLSKSKSTRKKVKKVPVKKKCVCKPRKIIRKVVRKVRRK